MFFLSYSDLYNNLNNYTAKKVAFFLIIGIFFVVSTAAQKTDRYAQLVDLKSSKDSLVLFALDLNVPVGTPDKSGDCMILISPDNKIMLVDSGHPESSEPIIKLLQDVGITKIDYFIMTHPHIDHLGGFPAIAAQFPISTVYRSHLTYAGTYYTNFEETCKKLSISVQYLSEGDSISFGNAIVGKVYNPPAKVEYPKNFPANSTEFINNNSLLIQFVFGNTKLLLGGDLYSPRENELVKKYGVALKSDIAKMNHHGMGTSNTLSWIRAVTPKAAFAMNDVMSTMNVLNTYKKYGAKVYLMLEDGLTRFSIKNNATFTALTQFDSWLKDF